MEKIPKKYSCEICEYYTNNKKDITKHNETKKHKKIIEGGSQRENKINTFYTCTICYKMYRAKNSLWYHCEKHHKENKSEETNDKQLLIELLQQNKDLQQQIIEMSKETKYVTNSNNTNSHNKNFNLNFFLNETCKDAMNLMDFVNSLQIKLSDFETTGRIGYVEGISKIIVNGLRQMDVNKRPIHCTDIKRETMYIRNEDTWEKENDDRTKLANAVKIVANKNFQQMREWQEKYPDCVVNNTSKNDEFVNIMLAVLGGQSEEEEDKNRDKILRNIAKEVIINKNCPD
jgi:hypothetical protein